MFSNSVINELINNEGKYMKIENEKILLDSVEVSLQYLFVHYIFKFEDFYFHLDTKEEGNKTYLIFTEKGKTKIREFYLSQKDFLVKYIESTLKNFIDECLTVKNNKFNWI